MDCQYRIRRFHRSEDPLEEGERAGKLQVDRQFLVTKSWKFEMPSGFSL